MPEKKKLPVGIDNFEKIIKNNFYYVDKTEMIHSLIQNWSEVNLITRPRRFGKTLNMNMLQTFFEIGTDPTVFDGLKISEDREFCEKYMGQFPVISISLKNVEGMNFESACAAMKYAIGAEALRFSFLEKSPELCMSEDFKKIGENKAALDTFYEAEHLAHETPMEFCIRNGWEKYVYEMLVVDFLILNRDRHGANIEVLRNSEEKTLRLAPIFDHGLSLLFSCHTEEAVEKFDIMQDRPVQCFVGSYYAQQNLQLIPREKMPQLHPLQEKHKAILLEGLDGIIPRYLQEKIWNMIWKRWLYYENFCNQK